MLLTINRNWAIVLGILFAFPAAYFILINLLNEYGYSYLSNSVQPVLEQLGIKEGAGLNINLLILFGPLLAMGLNLMAVVKVTWYNQSDTFSIQFSIQKHWWNMVLAFFSGILLAVLIVYGIGENCNCY